MGSSKEEGKQRTDHICQSCADPYDEKGTEADGAINDDFCSDCYRDGTFAEPEITMAEMIERTVASRVKETHLTVDEAREYLDSIFPTLKRWVSPKFVSASKS
ncbi:MAG: zinc ribbon domain-containing protein [Candidatus Hodarchaeales archaeon]